MQQYIVIAILLLATWLVSAMSQKETMIDPADPVAKARCVKLAGKPTWSKFYFRRRLPSGKCPRGWEGTWCVDGMGKTYQNKQCRRKMSARVPMNDTTNIVTPAVMPSVIAPSVIAPVVIADVMPSAVVDDDENDMDDENEIENDMDDDN